VKNDVRDAADLADLLRMGRLPEAYIAGLTPRHRESDTTVHRGPITKQGSKLVRWAAIEACQRARPGSKLAADRTRIITAQGRNIGVVAAAAADTAHPRRLRPARRGDSLAGPRGRVSRGFRTQHGRAVGILS
jgi:transposase